MNKRFVGYFFLISFLIAISLPILNYKTYQRGENLSSLFKTDMAEELLNFTFYKLFNRSLNQAEVITGKDDFLFLGNQHDNVLHKTNGIYRPSLNEIEQFIAQLKNLQQWYEAQGVQFIMVIAPNPHSIYKENLPNWVHYEEGTLTDDIIKLSKKSHLYLLDLRPVLIAAKGDNYLYYKRDAHWNALGASIAFKSTIDFLNNKYKSSLNKPPYTITDNFMATGDLSNLLKINPLLKSKENSYQYSFKNNHMVCFGNINLDNYQLEPCSTVLNPSFGVNDTPKYILNKHALNNKKLLMLSDSMSIANSQLYNLSFSTIWKWHYGALYGENLTAFMKTHHPDIVIYQVTERALFLPTLFRTPSS